MNLWQTKHGTWCFISSKVKPTADLKVALMDGFWLLVDLIPGIIAFAVDFSTGAIYLPGSNLGQLDDDHIRTIQFKGSKQ